MKKFLFYFLLINSAATAQTLKDAMRQNDNEQYDAASDIYKKLIAKEPASGSLYYAFGNNLLDAGQQDSALMFFNKGLQVEPGNFVNMIGVAKVKLSQGLIAEAKTMIDQALQKNSKNTLVLLAAGEAYSQFKSKDLMSAQSYLENAIKLDPKNPDLYNALGDVYSELNNGTMAVSNYNKALNIDKNYIKAYLHRGQLYKRSTNYEGAIAEFENALVIDINFAPAYRELGEVYYLQRKPEKAKENYKKYLDLSKNNNAARLRYASFLFDSKSYAEALTELKQITPVDTNSIGMMRLSAYVYCETNDTLNAVNSINRVWVLTASDTTKRRTRDYEYYGKILVKTGNDSLGCQYIYQAYQMDPSKTDLLSEIGNIYMKFKRNIEASRMFQEKINTGKNVTAVDYFNLGKAYYFSKENVMADSAFMKVTELQTNYAYGYWWRGRANSQLDSDGKLGLAKPFYEKFIELSSSDSVSFAKIKKSDLVEAYGNIALAYYQQKNYEQATVYCKKVFELDPENQNAKTIMANIKIIKEGKIKQ